MARKVVLFRPNLQPRLGGAFFDWRYTTANVTDKTTVLAWVCEIRAFYWIRCQASETNLQERLCRPHGATRREPQ
jgi:hypothetical protein